MTFAARRAFPVATLLALAPASFAQQFTIQPNLPTTALVAGAAIDGQYWARDPGFAPPNNANLSDAVHVQICP
jgi:hypothetical protein